MLIGSNAGTCVAREREIEPGARVLQVDGIHPKKNDNSHPSGRIGSRVQFKTRVVPRSLVPPSLASGSEIFFGPCGECNFSILGGITMCEGERQRSGSSDDVSVRCVLWSVARTHELVVRGRPWDDTTQMRTHCPAGGGRCWWCGGDRIGLKNDAWYVSGMEQKQYKHSYVMGLFPFIRV